jgi:hypothetical protein
MADHRKTLDVTPAGDCMEHFAFSTRDQNVHESQLVKRDVAHTEESSHCSAVPETAQMLNSLRSHAQRTGRTQGTCIAPGLQPGPDGGNSTSRPSIDQLLVLRGLPSALRCEMQCFGSDGAAIVNCRTRQSNDAKQRALARTLINPPQIC